MNNFWIRLAVWTFIALGFPALSGAMYGWEGVSPWMIGLSIFFTLVELAIKFLTVK